MAHRKADEKDLIRQLGEIVQSYAEVRSFSTVRLSRHTAMDIVLTNGKKFRHICNPNPMNRENNLSQLRRTMRMLTNPLFADQVHCLKGLTTSIS